MTHTHPRKAESPRTSFKPSGRAKVTKRYDTAATPYQRAIARDDVAGKNRTQMQRTMAAIHPGDLYRQIRDLTSRLENLALAKAPAPVKPKVNTAFNKTRPAKVLSEAMIQASRRI